MLSKVKLLCTGFDTKDDLDPPPRWRLVLTRLGGHTSAAFPQPPRIELERAEICIHLSNSWLGILPRSQDGAGWKGEQEGVDRQHV